MARRIKLNLPNLEQKLLTERPSSRTDQLVEASFSSDMSPIQDSPQPKITSQKPVPSINKLREVLAKTSEKLSLYTGKTDSSSHSDILERSKEVSDLRKQIRQLEIEKKELQEINRRLSESSMALREPTADSDVATIKITKFSTTLFTKIKDNPTWTRSLMGIIKSEDDFFAQIKSESFKKPLLDLLQFLCEVADGVSVPSPRPYVSALSNPLREGISEVQRSVRSYSSMADDDYCKLIDESDALARTIANQKMKIAQICDRVKESMNKTKNSLSPAGYLRSNSSLVRYDRPYSTSPNFVRAPIIEENDER